MPAAGKLPGLDGLRAAAALAVFVDHAEQTQEWVGRDHFDGNQMTSLGRQGVEVFFVLSGYLITLLLLRERARFGAVSLPRFYARRTLRIWPLYYLVVFLLWVVLPWAVQFAPPQIQALSEIHTRTLGAPGDPRLPLYLLFLANFSFWLYPHVLCGAHLWSLGVEEQFYLVWPVIFRFVPRPLAMFGALVVLVVSHRAAPSRLLDHPAVTWLGRRSYGFYMIHPLLMVLAMALLEYGGRYSPALTRDGAPEHLVFYLLAFTLTAAGAWLSYRFLETPLLRAKDRYFTAHR